MFSRFKRRFYTPILRQFTTKSPTRDANVTSSTSRVAKLLSFKRMTPQYQLLPVSLRSPLRVIIVGTFAAVAVETIRKGFSSMFGVKDQQMIDFALKSNGRDMFLPTVVISPIIEEIIFRGIIFRGLCGFISAGNAVLVSAGLFALPHVSQEPGTSTGFRMGLLLSSFSVGIILAASFIVTGAIAVPISIHAANNFLGCLPFLMDPSCPNGHSFEARSGDDNFKPRDFQCVKCMRSVVSTPETQRCENPGCCFQVCDNCAQLPRWF